MDFCLSGLSMWFVFKVRRRCAISGMKSHVGDMPCASCDCTLVNRHIGYESCSLTYLPWAVTTHESYMHQLNQQLIRVTLQNNAARDFIAANATWAQAWPWGRSIKTNPPQLILEMRLRPGDQVIPCFAYFNAHELDTASFPD